MSTNFARDLESYNRFILRTQDRAYTLAVQLRGMADPLAEKILQDTYRDCFDLWKHSGPDNPDFETNLLRRMLQRCRKSGPILGPPQFQKTFSILSCDEKMALILVDCLECTSCEAAQILAWPASQLVRILAGARLKISPRLPKQVAAG